MSISESVAIQSECGRYTYVRTLDFEGGKKGTCAIIGLGALVEGNKDAEQTWAICADVVKSLGYSRMLYVSLFAQSSGTDGEQLVDPVGPDNDKWIIKAAHDAEITICAWGEVPYIGKRAYGLLNVLNDVDLFCIQSNRRGSPMHPRAWKQRAPKMYRAATQKQSLPSAG